MARDYLAITGKKFIMYIKLTINMIIKYLYYIN